MLKKTALITGVLLLTGCAHVPYNHNRLYASAHYNCTKLKEALNVGYHSHSPGANNGKSVSVSERAAEMRLYERDCGK